LYAGTVATTHLHFFAIQPFDSQEPSSLSASVILHILLIAMLVRLIRELAALLVSLAVQFLPLSKRILGLLKNREEES
jgi:hypothetical protein